MLAEALVHIRTGYDLLTATNPECLEDGKFAFIESTESDERGADVTLIDAIERALRIAVAVGDADAEHDALTAACRWREESGHPNLAAR